MHTAVSALACSLLIAVGLAGSACSTLSSPREMSPVERTLAAKRGAFDECYRTRSAKPLRDGTVKAKFVVQADGKATDVVIDSSSLKDAGTENCVVEVIRATTFPKPEPPATIDVIYPIEFNSLQ